MPAHSLLPSVRRAVAIAACSLAAVAPAAHAQEAAGRLIVQARPGLPDAAFKRLLAENGGGRFARIGRSEMRLVHLPEGVAAAAAAERLARHPHVEFAEVDRKVKPLMTANDPYVGSEWHLGRIGALSAWDLAQGSGITIAIVDTGVDATHPDLAARIVPGWNVQDNNPNTADVHGHGTSVAGSAAAIGNNGIGVAGVAARAQIMPIRASLADGSAYLSALAAGITWAADNGARVANVSYQATDSSAVVSAGNYMKSKGGLAIIAAGNNGVVESIAPTSALVTVSATDSADNVAGWSSTGGYVTLSAPGVGIYTTTRGGGYGGFSGTSAAAPVAAGVVGLMMSANPALPASQIESLLYATALDLGAAGRDPSYGHGRVDAAAAVRAAAGATTTADTQPPSVAVTSPGAAATVGGLVGVSVTAGDNVGVSRVELRVNGVLVATDTSAPYAFSWDSSGIASGSATFVATAYDAAGNAGASAPVGVVVANAADTAAPAVAIANPKPGTRVSGMVAVMVSASDDRGSAGITQTLTIDGRVVASGKGGTLSYKWNTNKLAAGVHTLVAQARDAAGNVGTTTISVNR